MQIPIELLIIIILLFVLIVWAVWKRLTDWINKKRYNETRDKSKGGETKRREQIASELAAGKSIPESTTDIVPRPSELEGRELLQTTASDNLAESERNNGTEQSASGTPSISIGKVKLGFSNPFRRKKG